MPKHHQSGGRLGGKEPAGLDRPGGPPARYPSAHTFLQGRRFPPTPPGFPGSRFCADGLVQAPR